MAGSPLPRATTDRASKSSSRRSFAPSAVQYCHVASAKRQFVGESTPGEKGRNELEVESTPETRRYLRDELELYRLIRDNFTTSPWYHEVNLDAKPPLAEEKQQSPGEESPTGPRIFPSIKVPPPLHIEFENEPLFVIKRNRYFSGGFEPQMTMDEAALVLGIPLEDAADQKKLTSAHRRVMLRNHPDRGGSPFLATKINEAKDLLLNASVDVEAMKRKKAKESEAQEKQDVQEAKMKDEARARNKKNTSKKKSREAEE